jgi:hypothetical protein
LAQWSLISTVVRNQKQRTDGQKVRRPKARTLTAEQVANIATSDGIPEQTFAKTSGAHRASQWNMISPLPDFEPLTKQIIACAIEVHKTLGPGLLESVYQECMEVELNDANLEFRSEHRT